MFRWKRQDIYIKGLFSAVCAFKYPVFLIHLHARRFSFFLFLSFNIFIDQHWILLSSGKRRIVYIRGIHTMCVYMYVCSIHIRGKKDFEGSEVQARVWPVVLARISGRADQVSQSVWTWTPPEMVIQGEVSLVSHKVNLKVTTERQSQEKYYKALCTHFSEILPKFPPPRPWFPLPRDRAPHAAHHPASKCVKHGR